MVTSTLRPASNSSFRTSAFFAGEIEDAIRLQVSNGRLHHRAVCRDGHQHIVAYRHLLGVTAAQKGADLIADLPIGLFLGFFASSAYFRRVFKAVIGATPRDYRKK